MSRGFLLSVEKPTILFENFTQKYNGQPAAHAKYDLPEKLNANSMQLSFKLQF